MKINNLAAFVLLGFLAGHCCLLLGLVSLVGPTPVAMSILIILLAGVTPSASGAPVPEITPVSRMAAIVDGLPTCAQPIMANMVNRATSFGCAPLPNGMPNVVCLCTSKPFKSGAKRGINNACPNGSQTGDSRKWAISLCTEALARGSRRRPKPTKPTKPSKGVSRALDTANEPAQDWPQDTTGTLKWIPASATTAPVHHAHGSSGGNVKTSTPHGTLPYAVFDIDDDEDETAGAGMVRPVGSLSVVVAVVVAAAVMW